MAKRTILVVDDENGIRSMLGEFLAMFDYDTIICKDGEHAIPNIGKADLIITDFNMPPGMNGAELTKIAKREKPGMPVIIITGTPWDIPADHWADAVVEKPFRIEQLKKVIANLLNKPLGGCYD